MEFKFEDKHKVNDTMVQAEETWNYQEKGAGDSIEGLLVSIRKNIGENKSNVYTIEKSNGTLVDVWGCAVIDHHLGNLEKGQWGVKLVYLGKQQPQSGGRPYHNLEIYLVPRSEGVEDVEES